MSKKKTGKNANKVVWYRQCTLNSETKSGTETQTAWIPEKFAVLDKSVYFGGKTDSPEQLWKVASVGDIRKSGEYLGEHERDYLRQRSASDI